MPSAYIMLQYSSTFPASCKSFGGVDLPGGIPLEKRSVAASGERGVFGCFVARAEIETTHRP